MKKLKTIGYALLTFILLMGLQNVKAAELVEDLSESYKTWSSLSEDEKKKLIQPLPFNVTYTDSSKVANSKMYSARSTYQDKYQLSNVVVKNQEDTNECWAFSVSSVLETNLYKLLGTSYTLSPRHMDYYTSKTFKDNVINPDGYNREVGDGGNAYIGLSYYTSGHGPIAEEEMPFENNENKIELSQVQGKTTVKKVKDYTAFPSIYKEYTTNSGVSTVSKYYNGYNESSSWRVEYTEEQVSTMRDNIKSHIMQYGAVAAYTYAGTEDSINYYNIAKLQAGTATTFAYYCDDASAQLDHAVTIVGWDDNYSADNFNDNHKPSKNGAYIVLNSYGEDSYSNGYLYISYDDVLIERSLFGIVETSDVDYDNIYQHDPLGFSLEYTPQSTTGNTFATLYAANVFDTTKKEGTTEKLTEISFYIASTTNVSVYVNTQNGNLSESTLVKDLGEMTPGYHTYTFDEPVSLTGEKFVVALKYDSDVATIPLECNYTSNGGSSNYWDTATSQEGQSYISTNKTSWTDLIDIGIENSNICIKAFSKYEATASSPVEVTAITLNQKDVSLTVGDFVTLSATITPDNATDKTIIWTSSNENIATVSSSGKITAIAEGTATITASNAAKTISDTCTVTVSAKASSPIEVTAITLNQKDVSLTVGDFVTLSATITPDNATDKTIIWTSSNENIATVSSSGKITAIAEGTATITASNAAKTISDTCTVTVSAKASGEEDKKQDENQNEIQDETQNQVDEPSFEENEIPDSNIVINTGDNDGTDDGEQIEKVTQFTGSNDGSSTTSDTTISPDSIPQAGANTIIITIAIGILGIAIIIIVIKLYKSRDIK